MATGSSSRREDSGIDSDIYIPAALTDSAMNGDKVNIEITMRKPGGRAEGRVVTVEKRARTPSSATAYDGQTFFVAPTDENVAFQILIMKRCVRTQGQDRRSGDHQVPKRGPMACRKSVSVIGFIDDRTSRRMSSSGNSDCHRLSRPM